jgi:hypothetical protein
MQRLGLLAGFVIYSFEVAVLEFVRLLIPVTCLGGARCLPQTVAHFVYPTYFRWTVLYRILQ